MLRRGTPRLTKRWHSEIPDHVIAAGFSSDGKRIATAAISGLVAVFDSASGMRQFDLPGHRFGTSAIAWQPNSNLLASAGQDSFVRLWDADRGVKIGELSGGANWVECLAWNQAGDILASGAGKKVRLWRPDGSMLRDYPPLGSTVADICWRPGSNDLTTTSYGSVSVWIPEGDSPKRVFEKPVSLLCAAWSPDSKYLAAGAQDASVYFWIWKSGRDLQMGGYPTKVRPPAWDRTSRFLATGGSAWALVWDCSGKGPEGTRPLMLEGHAEDKLVTALTYQKKGDILASGGADGKIILWQPITSQRPVTQLQLNAGISALTWSPDERLLLAGTETGSLFVYSV